MPHPQSTNGHAAPTDPVATGAGWFGRARSVTPRPPATRWQKVLAGLMIGYAVALVLLCLWMYWQGDREWLATLVLFGPRWVCGLPLPFLALAAAIWHRRLLWVAALSALVLVFPFLGLVLHWPASAAPATRLRVLTCNVDQNALDPQKLAQAIADNDADIVALQEINVVTRFVWPEGWHVLNRDEFILASRYPIEELRYFTHPLSPPEVAAVFYRVRLPDREVPIFNVHLRSPRPGIEAVLDKQANGPAQLDDVLEVRALESEATAIWVEGINEPMIIAGDFNMPCESWIFRRDWTAWDNAFGRTGLGFGFTKISRLGPLEYGTRIDHVLYHEAWTCIGSWVGANIGSDHLPLVAEFR